jgi:hypothetical protein
VELYGEEAVSAEQGREPEAVLTPPGDFMRSIHD